MARHVGLEGGRYLFVAIAIFAAILLCQTTHAIGSDYIDIEEHRQLFQSRDATMASASYVSRRLGTKRGYPGEDSKKNYTPPPQHCKLMHMEYLARHGTR